MIKHTLIEGKTLCSCGKKAKGFLFASIKRREKLDYLNPHCGTGYDSGFTEFREGTPAFNVSGEKVRYIYVHPDKRDGFLRKGE